MQVHQLICMAPKPLSAGRVVDWCVLRWLVFKVTTHDRVFLFQQRLVMTLRTGSDCCAPPEEVKRTEDACELGEVSERERKSQTHSFSLSSSFGHSNLKLIK